MNLKTTKTILYSAIALGLFGQFAFLLVGLLLTKSDWPFIIVLLCYALSVMSSAVSLRYGFFPKIVIFVLLTLLLISLLNLLAFNDKRDLQKEIQAERVIP